MERLKILYIPNNPETNASTLYRNLIPAKYLQKLGHKVDFLGPEYKPLKKFDYDIVVFNRFYMVDLPQVVAMCRLMGASIVFEIDDLVTQIPKNKASYEELKMVAHTAESLSKYADLVTVTTPELRSEMAKITTQPIEVVPNSLDMTQWKKRIGHTKKLRIGYTGSKMHFEDVNLFIGAIIELQKKYDFTFVIQGINSKTDMDELSTTKETQSEVKLFKKNLSKVKNIEEHDLVPLKEYPKKLAKLNLDIGICGLADNGFNHCKSALKMYEYVAVGTTPICSYIPPYKGEAVYTASDSQWYEKLGALILDHKLRQSVYDQQSVWFREKRTADKVVIKWEHIFKQLKKENDDRRRIVRSSLEGEGSGVDPKPKIITG